MCYGLCIYFSDELQGKETFTVTSHPSRLNSWYIAFLHLLASKSQGLLSSADRTDFAAGF